MKAFIEKNLQDRRDVRAKTDITRINLQELQLRRQLDAIRFNHTHGRMTSK